MPQSCNDSSHWLGSTPVSSVMNWFYWKLTWSITSTDSKWFYQLFSTWLELTRIDHWPDLTRLDSICNVGDPTRLCDSSWLDTTLANLHVHWMRYMAKLPVNWIAYAQFNRLKLVLANWHATPNITFTFIVNIPGSKPLAANRRTSSLISAAETPFIPYVDPTYAYRSVGGMPPSLTERFITGGT